MASTCKVYRFTKRDKNRYRKVYRYIRRKPVNEFISNEMFTLIVGKADFSNTSGPVTITFTDFDSAASFINAPVVTSVSVDSIGNNTADVNVFVTSVTTTGVTFESSAPFTGEVHFQVVSQD